MQTCITSSVNRKLVTTFTTHQSHLSSFVFVHSADDAKIPPRNYFFHRQADSHYASNLNHKLSAVMTIEYKEKPAYLLGYAYVWHAYRYPLICIHIMYAIHAHTVGHTCILDQLKY
jgi:hypothetical protein